MSGHIFHLDIARPAILNGRVQIIMNHALIFSCACCSKHYRIAPVAISIIAAISTNLYLIRCIWFEIGEFIQSVNDRMCSSVYFDLKRGGIGFPIHFSRCPF